MSKLEYYLEQIYNEGIYRSIKHGGEAYRCRKCGQVLVYIPGDTK